MKRHGMGWGQSHLAVGWSLLWTSQQTHSCGHPQLEGAPAGSFQGLEITHGPPKGEPNPTLRFGGPEHLSLSLQ